MHTIKQTILAVSSLLMLTTATSIAQSNDEKNIRIKIQIADDTRNLNIDTTFTDEASLQLWLKENNLDAPEPPTPPTPPAAPNAPSPSAKPHDADKNIRLKILTDKDEANINIDLEKMEEEIEAALEKLKDASVNFNFNSTDGNMDIIVKKFGGDKDSFAYSFTVPDCEKLKKEMKELNDEFKSFSFSFDADDEQLTEKESNAKDGKKVKRSSKVIIIETDKKTDKTKDKKEEGEKKQPAQKDKDTQKGQSAYELSPSHFELSPNPGKGVYQLSFSLPSTEPVTVNVIDFAGRQVFHDVAEDFNGSYSNRIDISGKSKGTYLLQVKQGKNWLHKKFMLN